MQPKKDEHDDLSIFQRNMCTDLSRFPMREQIVLEFLCRGSAMMETDNVPKSEVNLEKPGRD